MITDKDIQNVTEAFITITNQTGALDDVVKQYDTNQSLALKITGSRFRTGFILKNGKLRMLGDLDKSTVTITMDKEKYWDVINSENPGIARAKFFLGVFTEESIKFDPPPGTEGGALHMENIIKVFTAMAQSVMIGG